MIPIWFGAAERPLAGIIHPPEGECRGGAIICPPFGYEATCAYRTLRELADRLATRGIIVLRIDYFGTGASSGTGDEPDIVEHWQDSVANAITELRRRGVPRPAIVGMRLGAALGYSAAVADGDCGPVVAWAPIVSGRRYYRELRAFAVVTPGGQVDDGGLHVCGQAVPDALRFFDPWDGITPGSEVLVVQSVAEPPPVPNAELREIPGTADVLERTAEEAEVPTKILAAICGWLDGRVAEPTRSADVSASAPACRVEPDITEEFLRVGRIGLHGVLVHPANDEARTGRGVVFLNNGAAPSVGPGRAWVEFSRALATGGVTSLRLDFSGLGDSPDSRPRTKRLDAEPPTAGVEVLTAVELLRSRGVRDVTVVGLCSGAQIAVRTAAFAGRIDRVLAINPPLFYLPDVGVGPRIAKLWGMTTPIMGRGRLRRLVRLPAAGWTVLDRLRIFPSPVRFLRGAADRGTRVRLVFAPDDRGLLDIRTRAGAEFDREYAADRVGIDVVPGMDHSMFALAQRNEVFGILRDFCGVSRPAPNRLLT